MQKPINELVSEVIRVINTPPSRPIRLMFLENEIFYEMAQNQVKELFASNEIINMTNFMDFEAWKSREDELNVKCVAIKMESLWDSDEVFVYPDKKRVLKYIPEIDEYRYVPITNVILSKAEIPFLIFERNKGKCFIQKC